jgi:hypothetical protein
MSGPAWAGLIVEGDFDLAVVREVLADAWEGAQLRTVRLNQSTWVSPFWPDRTDVETFEAIAGGEKVAADVARRARVPTWWYEYFSRSAFFARAQRYDAGGRQTHELSADEDPEAFDKLAAELARAVGWPEEVFGDLQRLGELAQGPFSPRPEAVADDAKIEVRFELPRQLFEEIQQAAFDRDCSLSKVVQELIARPQGSTQRAFGGEVQGQRLYVTGRQWKALCADAKQHGQSPSQALLAKAASAPLR